MNKRLLACLLACCLILGSGCARSDPELSSSGSAGQTSQTTEQPVSSGTTTTESAAGMTNGTTESVIGTSAKTTAGSQATKTTTTKQLPTTTTPAAAAPTVPVVSASGKSTFTPTAMRGANTDVLLKNPDRGFRLELSVQIPHTDQAIASLQMLLDEYASDSPRIVQTYFYLTAYKDKDLDQAAINAMQTYMDFCRREKIQVLLRFAYVTSENTNQTEAASTEQMLRHMDQLQSFLAKNRDVLFALEAGFIAHWGEWSGGGTPERKPVLDHLLDIVPDDLFVLVRYTSIKNMLDEDDPRRARVGYHDDYLVGKSHRWSCGGIDGSKGYAQFLRESEDVLVQGEMPWGSQYSDVIDGMGMAKRLSTLHFSVMSLYHHYKEGGGYYAMQQWKERDYTASEFKAQGLTFHPDWFLDAEGNTMSGRDVFTYIRDYLGYYLVAENSDIEINGREVKTTVRLKNYGFATPLTMESCQLVVADEQGNIKSAVNACDVKDLKSGKQVACTAKLTLPDTGGGYYLGVVFKNHAGTPARLANELLYKNGVNLMCKIG